MKCQRQVGAPPCSFSTHNGSCVEVGDLSGGGIAVRNSNDPHGPTVLFTRAELDAFIRGCKAGEFDDLTWAATRRRHGGMASLH